MTSERGRTYAPWLNSVALGGVIWTKPTLRSVKYDGDKEFHVLGFFLMSWRAKHETHRKVAIAVDHKVMPEYWHSRLKAGDPVLVVGELRSRTYDHDGRRVTEQRIHSHTITLLHKPPPDYIAPQDVDIEE